MPRILLCLALLGLAACGGTSHGGAGQPGGRTVKAKCSACHLTPRPGRFTPEEIDSILGRHATRVRLSPAQEQDVRGYLARP